MQRGQRSSLQLQRVRSSYCRSQQPWRPLGCAFLRGRRVPGRYARSVVHWPAPRALPYERLPRDCDQSADYVSALLQLATDPRRSSIVFVSAASLTHAVMSRAGASSSASAESKWGLVRQSELFGWATSVGYEPVTIVQRVGEVARRGGIIDIYSPGSSGPTRLDFFGDEIDSIRLFDPNSQRSLERIDSIVLLPAIELPVWNLPTAARRFDSSTLSPLRFEVREELERTLDRAGDGVVPAELDLFAPFLLDGPTTILDHLPGRSTLIVLDDPGSILPWPVHNGTSMRAITTWQPSIAVSSRRDYPIHSSHSRIYYRRVANRQTVAFGAPESTTPKRSLSRDGPRHRSSPAACPDIVSTGLAAFA